MKLLHTECDNIVNKAENRPQIYIMKTIWNSWITDCLANKQLLLSSVVHNLQLTAFKRKHQKCDVWNSHSLQIIHLSVFLPASCVSMDGYCQSQNVCLWRLCTLTTSWATWNFITGIII